MSGAKEAAERVFERIRRRRTTPPISSPAPPMPSAQPAHAWTQPAPEASAATSTETLNEPLQIDELLFDGAPGAGSGLGSTFPRSATMRLLLKHPAMAIGVGVPAAALLLSSPSARRMLATVALRAGGASPELRQLLQASAAALQLAPAATPQTKEKKGPARGQIREET
jgi:hypothetical protein